MAGALALAVFARVERALVGGAGSSATGWGATLAAGRSTTPTISRSGGSTRAPPRPLAGIPRGPIPLTTAELEAVTMGWLRDLMGLQIGDGTPEIMKGIIARAAYGPGVSIYK